MQLISSETGIRFNFSALLICKHGLILTSRKINLLLKEWAVHRKQSKKLNISKIKVKIYINSKAHLYFNQFFKFIS